MVLFQMYVLSLLPQTQRLLTSMMQLCCWNSLHSVSLLKQAWLKNGTAFRVLISELWLSFGRTDPCLA